MPGPTALVDLTTVKTHLNITTTTNDTELTSMIDRATPIIEKIVGPVIQRIITDEQHEPTGATLALIERPVVSITTCTEFVGKVAYTITIITDPTTSGTYTATLDSDKGVLTRWATSSPREWAGFVWVTYVAGRDSVPSNVEYATLELIRHMWDTQRGGVSQRPGFDAEGDVTPILGYLVPNRVIEGLLPDTRIDGFA